MTTTTTGAVDKQGAGRNWADGGKLEEAEREEERVEELAEAREEREMFCVWRTETLQQVQDEPSW